MPVYSGNQDRKAAVLGPNLDIAAIVRFRIQAFLIHGVWECAILELSWSAEANSVEKKYRIRIIYR